MLLHFVCSSVCFFSVFIRDFTSCWGCLSNSSCHEFDATCRAMARICVERKDNAQQSCRIPDQSDNRGVFFFCTSTVLSRDCISEEQHNLVIASAVCPLLTLPTSRGTTTGHIAKGNFSTSIFRADYSLQVSNLAFPSQPWRKA